MSCVTLSAPGPAFDVDGYYAGSGTVDPTPPTGCVSLQVAGDLLYDQTFYELAPTLQSSVYFLQLEGGGFLLVSNADGVAGTADDYKLYLF
jgi:hypothetical protein